MAVMDRFTVYLLRNARATMYAPTGVKDGEFIKVVRKYHRNRIVLVDPATVSGELGKPFVVTEAPFEKGLLKELDGAGRTLLLAATTGTPILAYPDDFDDLKKYSLFPIKTKGRPSFDQVLRHLRIAEYSQIDFLVNPPREIPEDLKRDYEKRFWRIRGDDFLFGAYLGLGLGGELASSVVLGLKFLPPGD